MNKFLDIALAGIQHLSPYVPGKPVEELQRELGLSEIVKLASNENPSAPSDKVRTAIQEFLSELTRYPDGSGFQLKSALARRLAVSPEQITLGNGSSEILELVVRTFVSSDLEVVFSQHAFALYPILTQAVGATAKVVPAKNYGHDLAAMRDQISNKTRLVFIANPNNPTGTILANEEIEQFLASLPPQVLCIIDEAYFEFVPEKSQINSLDWPSRFPNAIIARTFSKAYGLAGLRIGYAISSVDVADLLNRIRPPFNNNALALVAAQAALEDLETLQFSIKQNQQGMLQLTNAFQQLGLEWIPSSGNFISVDMKLPAMPVYEALLRQGVIVRPVANYEMPTHLRISIGSSAENQKFIDSLARVLQDV